MWKKTRKVPGIPRKIEKEKLSCNLPFHESLAHSSRHPRTCSQQSLLRVILIRLRVEFVCISFARFLYFGAQNFPENGSGKGEGVVPDGEVETLDLDLESNRQTPRRDITPMEMKGGTTEDDA